MCKSVLSLNFFILFLSSMIMQLVTYSIDFVQGTIDQFDYPKKGKNIPPSKHDAPPREEPAEDPGQDAEGEEGD